MNEDKVIIFSDDGTISQEELFSGDSEEDESEEK